MAKKANAIYEPGELDRVRGKLGSIDEQEAKRMAQLLGGEVGYEKNQPGAAKKGQIKRETAGGSGGRPRRLVELAGDEAEAASKKTASRASGGGPADDPSVQLKISYFERVKMDRYAAQFEFEIKNSFQALASIFSLFSEPADYVNPRFVTRRMNGYYRKIEQLVTSTRGLFPRNNARRNERVKRTSSFVYAILDTIRRWNIERIDDDLAKIQSHPRSARISEFADILRAVYKPLFALDQLDMDAHIKGAYKLLYKILCIENPLEPKEKNQELIRIALASFADIRRDIQFGLYPMVMKLISDRWLPYERLFVERRNRYMAFLNVTDDDQIQAVDTSPEQVEGGDLEAIRADVRKEQEETAAEEPADEDPDDPKVAARKAREAALEAERKALDHSLAALEALFPKAGWERLSEYPDLYPYFADPYELRRGYELIPPGDPLQQIAVLMHILEDLLVGLRHAAFNGGEDGLGDAIINWRRYIEDSFVKEYLPRLVEYCRILENSAESRTSPYAKRIVNDLHWTKRLYFLPYYKFESLGPPPFQKQEITPVYSEIRTLRKYLTSVAAGIERSSHQGGADADASCDEIDNPWDAYDFDVPNPVSKRLDALLGQGKRNNAALVFFALSVTTILDYLINNESSWAYSDRPGLLFRSVNSEGTRPMFGVDNKLDADQIFKDTLKQKEGQNPPSGMP